MPPEAKMFMIEHFKVIRLVRRDVWLGLVETGCTGMKFSAIPDVAVHGPVHYVKPDYSKIPRDDPDDGDESPATPGPTPPTPEPAPKPSSKPSSEAASKQPSPRPRKGR
ncbi:hypothetical protein J4558_07280 [Leptolyngbya sp. 15MV]|nr:hypothetical protein J4558_07280 [Leptolyngbya sp. 15MV]